jgi:Fe-S-cluster containining protein
VTPFRLRRIGGLLGLGERALREQYVTQDENGETVLKLKEDGDCIFWDQGCTIYPERPRQCRTFPFWGEMLASPGSWSKLREFCHGVDQGRLYRLEDIRAVFKGRATKG